MKILSIETSCDETAAAVVLNGRKVLSSKIASQIKEHNLYGGVVPEIASRRHIENISTVVKNALEFSNNKLSNIDAIAATHAPGLVGSLLVGLNFAKGLSFALNLPLIAVHHLRSHVAANYLTYKNLTPPFLCLVVSGGHTFILEVLDYTKFKIFSKTCDDAAGETLDKAARALKLSYPGGVNLDKISKLGNKFLFNFPKPKVDSSPYDFSFSGLKTSMINKIQERKQKSIKLPIEDLSASFCHCVASYLTEKLLLVAKNKNYKKIAISGGVSANSHLRKMLIKECKEKKYELYIPKLELCTDNAAMVGSQAYYEYKSGNIAKLNINAQANLSIE
ncbi:MAG: tRNA (adenosine(37)-N6)-threonylcarbamoyltransferase complex transferase subunit TsaD [Oscillospiraceae bacterium]|jgi:N6-L-threonylcarbamoyladenine synthase|nr:tRNA (adenosine(37)-N6)-threonylcarbamoyltransferase complex transferase subunit TsaD [Oscillospiraceae bacterium]